MTSIQDTLRGIAAGIFIERPAAGKDIHYWISELEISAIGIDQIEMHASLESKKMR